MLERSDAFLRANLADFVVAEGDGTFLGCGALAALTGDLAEVRSLAVAPDAGGKASGRRSSRRASSARANAGSAASSR